MSAEFTSPSIAYHALLPIIIPAGAAVLGVLVDAFVPASQRWRAQVGVALGGLLGALIAVPVVASVLIIVKQVVIPRQNAA